MRRSKLTREMQLYSTGKKQPNKAPEENKHPLRKAGTAHVPLGSFHVGPCEKQL